MMHEETEAAREEIRRRRQATQPPPEAEIRAYVRGELPAAAAGDLRSRLLSSADGERALEAAVLAESTAMGHVPLALLFEVRGIPALEAAGDERARLSAAPPAGPGMNAGTLDVRVDDARATVLIDQGGELRIRVTRHGQPQVGARVTLRLVGAEGSSHVVAAKSTDPEGAVTFGRVAFIPRPTAGTHYVLSVTGE